jgi:DNA-binding SARP family transcriptional activator
VGRNRLRNLLSRVRSAAGEVLVRDGEVIMLESAAEVDAVAFETAARQALSAGQAGAALARPALARYRGELLPDDRYEAWAARPRERLRGLYLELLDLIAVDAEQRGEFDEAIRQLRRAIEAEPGDEDRHVRLARLLAAQGRAGSARSVIRQARAALDELGLPVSAALRALEATLGGVPG